MIMRVRDNVGQVLNMVFDLAYKEMVLAKIIIITQSLSLDWVIL